jgi:hypothetical protein
MFDEKDARTLAIRFQEVTEVARHRPKIGSDKNPILMRGEGQHVGVGNSFQPGLVGRKKSMAGSRRRHPVTIASLRLASARKRIIGQLRRETIC